MVQAENKDPRCYTEKQSEDVLKELQNIFTVARILKEKEVAGECHHEGQPCYAFWGKSEPCENCTSYKTLKDKKDRLKYEYIDGKPYQILSEYVTVDGTPSVMEMLKEINNVTMSPEDAKTLATRLLDINSELYRDALTGVLNRAYFEDNKNTHILNAGIAFIDIDNFKMVNDKLGHRMGDTVLRILGEILIKNTRDTDRVIRYGGDEFVLILPSITKDRFEERLETIRKQLEDVNMFEDIKFSLSIGGFICKEMSLQNAAEIADTLMYEAKKEKNKVVIKEVLHQD